jgi:multisubunit Na+/H+ antiporter MnhG subunit
VQENALLGTILLIVATILIGWSMILPWYYQEISITTMEFHVEGEIDYYLDHATSNAIFDLPGDYSGLERSGGIDEIQYDNETISNLKFYQTLKTTQIMAIAGLVGCIIGMMGATLVLLKKIGTTLGILLVLIAVILSLMAPIYIMFTLPAAYQEDLENEGVTDSSSSGIGSDFFGNKEMRTENFAVEMSWGGSFGWFMALAAMVLCVVALFLVIFSRTKPTTYSPSYSEPQINYDKHGFPTAHKEDGWSDYNTYETVDDTETEAPLVFPPFGPKPAGSSLTRRFQCPECEGIVVISVPKRPLDVKCSKCGTSGIVE